ncbi:MAG: PAS domain S-box protein [Burkholderiales bacterium]
MSLGLFALSYLAAMALGHWLAPVPGNPATIWPATGLYLATLLWHPPRSWRYWIVTAFACEWSALSWAHGLVIGLAGAAATSLVAVLAAWLLRRFVGTPFRYDTPRNVLALALVAATLCPAIGATIGAAALSATGEQSFTNVWLLWWIGDLTGILLAAPLTLLALRGRDLPIPAGKIRWLEMACLCASLALITHVVFSGRFPLVFATMPPLLWAVLRFGMPGAAIALALLALMVMRYTVTGNGPYADAHASPVTSALLAQAFIGIVAICTQVLAALISQRETAWRALQRAHSQLEDRVSARTATLRQSEEELRAAISEYQALLAASPAWVFAVGEERTIIQASGAMERLFGCAKGELLGRRTRELCANADGWRAIEPEDYDDFRNRGLARAELQFRRKDGTFFWGLLHGLPIDSQDPHKGRLFAVMDITAEKLSGQQALQDSETRFRDMAVNVPGVIYQWVERADGSYGFTYASPRIEEYFHVPAGHPDKIIAFIHPEDLPKFRASIEDVKKDPRPWRFEGRYFDPRDGSVRWWRTMSRLASETGKERIFNGVLFDITEEKHAQQISLVASERLNLALNGSQLGLWDFDLEKGQVYLNEQWAQILERPAKESVVPIDELRAMLHPDDAPRVLATFTSALKGIIPAYAVEHRVKTASGRWKWIYSHGMVTRRDSSGRALRMTGTNADIDARKDAEARLAQLLREQQALLAASPAGVFTVGNDRTITQANDAMEQMFGYGRGRMLGVSTQDVLCSDDAWHWIGTEGYRQIREQGLMRAEIEYRRRDGSRFWGLLQGVQIDPLDPSRGRLFAVVNIDAQKLAEKNTLDLVANNVPLMIAQFDADLCCRFGNQYFNGAFDGGAGPVTGRRLTELLDPVDHAIVQDYFREALEGKTVSFERSFTLGQRRKVRFAARLVPAPSLDGKAGVFAFFQAASEKAAKAS